MSTRFIPIIASQAGGNGSFSVRALESHLLGKWASPVLLLDEFRVTGRPFPPHPHAGFSAVTYVLEDSNGNLRSRDSLGNDLVTGPGGVVWTQAASGLLHEELPSDPHRELHAVQVFVNLSSRNKFVAPKTLRLQAKEVPEWRSESGDRVRAVVGTFRTTQSPLSPAEPFTLLDVQLRSHLAFDLPDGHNSVVYVLSGSVRLDNGVQASEVVGGGALVAHGGGGPLSVTANLNSKLLFLSGADLHEPVVARGPFVMNDDSQIADSVARYEGGAMGHLGALAAR